MRFLGLLRDFGISFRMVGLDPNHDVDDIRVEIDRCDAVYFQAWIFDREGKFVEIGTRE